jgi:hypothetical protein
MSTYFRHLSNLFLHVFIMAPTVLSAAASAPHRHPTSAHQHKHITKMPFSLQGLNAIVTQVQPDELQQIIFRIFRELAMRHNGNRVEHTGFEAATEDELHLAVYRTVNELLIRLGLLQDQLGIVRMCSVRSRAVEWNEYLRVWSASMSSGLRWFR